MTSAQSLRAARNLAISSKKSLCELKKNEIRGAKSSTSRPASMPVLHVLDAVAQRERQLLQRRRARLADVIPAHRTVFQRGTSFAQNAKTSVMSRIDSRGG